MKCCRYISTKSFQFFTHFNIDLIFLIEYSKNYSVTTNIFTKNFIDSIICLNSALLYKKLPPLGRIIGCIGMFSFNDFIIEFFEGVNPPFSLFVHNSILLISNFDISVQSLILNAHISKL